MLDPAIRQILEVCGRLMTVGDQNRALDLFSFRGVFRTSATECIEVLRVTVEAESGGRLTVREADCSVIPGAPMGISNLFVVVCVADTPSGRVTQLSPDMAPYAIAPGKGFGCAKMQ
jgi:hypothetical protein